ncbi:MAG: LuxR C-terminal-related transcriptional regulator [Hyphomonadaceae bacterium]|nr:LuxR C-terminal-related transcriptional regulator [Hyphomonadaceae bacterium]
MTRSRGRPPYQDILTPAEWKVVEAVRHGLTNRAIANKMAISPDAVKYHVANALSKLGFTRRAELRAWNGIAQASALAERPVDMHAETKLASLGQVGRAVADIDAARHWYERVLGLEHLYSFGNLAFFNCDGVRLFLFEEDEGQANSILYFRVADVRSAHKNLEERGVTFISAPHMIHRHQDGSEEWMAFFHDNEGRPLAIMCTVSAP